jgi:uncharacterized membrane protein YdfJ with MMPL/SSD domain
VSEATVIFTSQLPSPNPSRQGQISTLVSFTVDAGPPDSVIIESERPTDTEIQQAIAAAVGRKKELAGKKFAL